MAMEVYCLLWTLWRIKRDYFNERMLSLSLSRKLFTTPLSSANFFLPSTMAGRRTLWKFITAQLSSSVAGHLPETRAISTGFARLVNAWPKHVYTYTANVINRIV